MQKAECLNTPQKKRIEYLDIARTFAILSVILCHAVEMTYNMGIEEWLTFSLPSKLFRTIAFTIGRLGVPIFMFISGYLLLSRSFQDHTDIKKFYKKNLLPLIIATEIWFVFYHVFMAVYDHTTINVRMLIKHMLFIEKGTLGNMWYMPMIIGIYIAIPFVSKVVQTFTLKSLSVPIGTIFFLIFILPTVNTILAAFGFGPYWNILDISFLGGLYGIYLIFGYYIYKKLLKKVRTGPIIILSILSFVLACAIQIFGFNHKILSDIWYDSPFIFICSLCLFELFTRINTDKISITIKKAFTYISKSSLALYFIHILVEIVLCKYTRQMPLPYPIKVVVLFATCSIITILITWIISKVKFIKTKILLIK